MKSFNKLSKTFIIAEAGVNHLGKIAYAEKLIKEASRAGVDIIKFQTYNVDRYIDPKLKKSYERLKKFSLLEIYM